MANVPPADRQLEKKMNAAAAAVSAPERQNLRLMPCRHGSMLFPRGDMFIGRSLELYGEWSEGEVALFSDLLHPGDEVVEAGANIGTHTLALARLVGPKGRVWALEPQRLTFQLLCGNLALNEIEAVEAIHVAAGAAAGTTRIPHLGYGAHANFGGVAIGGGEDSARVIAIDELPLARCRLLKVDVEGHEVETLRGAARTIARHRPILSVEDDRPDGHAGLMALLREYDYRAWWHRVPLFSAENFRRNPANVFSTVVSINLLCLPRESTETLSLRLPEAPWEGRHIAAR